MAPRGRGGPAPRKGPGTQRPTRTNQPRPSRPLLARKGSMWEGCRLGSGVCVSSGESPACPSPLSTVSGTGGGLEPVCSPPADVPRVDRRAYENLPELYRCVFKLQTFYSIYFYIQLLMCILRFSVKMHLSSCTPAKSRSIRRGLAMCWSCPPSDLVGVT